MKNRRLLPFLLSASLCSALSWSALTPSVLAQPNATTGKKGRAKGAKHAKGGVTPKMMAKIETALGKPLTEDQKSRLNAANKIRQESQKAAAAKFAAEVSNITGLSADQVKTLTKRGPKADGAGKMAPR